MHGTMENHLGFANLHAKQGTMYCIVGIYCVACFPKYGRSQFWAYIVAFVYRNFSKCLSYKGGAVEFFFDLLDLENLRRM